jgi:adenosylcobinamide-GDP ribazoletransferase
MFTHYAKPSYLYNAFGICLALLYTCGLAYLYAAFVAFFISLGIAHFLSGQLGGLTGDTYGFLTECGHVIYMLAAVYLLR